MEETAAISSSPSSSSAVGDVGPSTSVEPTPMSPEVLSEEEQEREEGEAIRGPDEVPELVRQQTSTYYRVVPMPPRRMASSMAPEDLPADDTLSCFVVILTFWFFVSMTLIMGIFGSEDLQLGPYSSILLKPNPLFVSYLKVMEAPEALKAAPVVYGLYKPPSLDIAKIWSQSRSTSVKADSHKEWVHYLNEGSQINISYNVPSSSSVVLVIAEGIEGLAEWVEDPLYPESALSWNVIRGNGTVRLDILKSYDYYVAVGNFNSEDVKVGLDFSIRSTMYDASDSYYKCNLTKGLCSLRILFPEGNLAVLTTPGPDKGAESGEVYVKLSYEPRWITYLLGIGGMTSIMIWAFNFINGLRRNNENTQENRSGNAGMDRAPLLSQKDDDVSSLGSSYDSSSQNEDEPQDLEEGLSERRSVGKGGKKYSPRQLCVICYDAPKDCFFIPCGHCASCFNCGVRIAEVAGTCPICRRRMKKVRKIYTV